MFCHVDWVFSQISMPSPFMASFAHNLVIFTFSGHFRPKHRDAWPFMGMLRPLWPSSPPNEDFVNLTANFCPNLENSLPSVLVRATNVEMTFLEEICFFFFPHLGPFGRKEISLRLLRRGASWHWGTLWGILVPSVSPWVLVLVGLHGATPHDKNGILLYVSKSGHFLTSMASFAQNIRISVSFMAMVAQNLEAFHPLWPILPKNIRISMSSMVMVAQNLGTFHPLCPKYNNFCVFDGHGGSKPGDVPPFMANFAPNPRISMSLMGMVAQNLGTFHLIWPILPKI